MKTNITGLLLCLIVLVGIFSGCTRDAEPTLPEAQEIQAATEPTVPATTPMPGNPGDVTCKGSYSAEPFNPDAVVATAADAQLTNGELQVWYALTVAAYQQELHRDAAPDFSGKLDTQPCPIDESVGSWQQYFLKQALNAWHSAQALGLQAAEVPLVTEPAYKPIEGNYETYMTGMPATKYLYGYNPFFSPNSMHQAYLDALPETLNALAQEKGFSGLPELAGALGVSEETLIGVAHQFNFSYMYFTELCYDVEDMKEQMQTVPEVDAASAAAAEKTVSIRHILMVPEQQDEAGWLDCEKKAQKLLESWKKMYRRSEGAFADLAYKNSLDTGTAGDGGAYLNLRQGQLMDALDSWCFDEARQPEDTTILRTDMGIHILYFAGSSDTAFAQAEAALTAEQQAQLITGAKELYPADIDYETITLAWEKAGLSFSDILYPDIAHERFPEVPLYLQQDYPGTMYGGFKLSTNGCGITSLAMLASYMADDELTPPEMCARYGHYSHSNGTDGMIFNYEAPVMGFYLREKTYDPPVAKAALEEGQIVISVQHKGYWTRGGHYLVLEKMNEDGTIQVRDSNLFNYKRVPAHIGDSHAWSDITGAGSGYWIYEDKITTIPGCSRCGDPDCLLPELFTGEYYCRKCAPALLRRSTYLSSCLT
nr:peptidylprolyl isomerase [Oscillospiraceae bacterium]